MKAHKTHRAIVVLSLALALSIGFSVGVYFRSFQEKQGETLSFAQAPLPPLETGMQSFRHVAQRVLPTVVQIDTVKVVERTIRNINPFDFFDFFREEGDRKKEKNNKEEKQEFRSAGLGSGVIIRNQGNLYYVLTNNHVVADADEMKVILNDEESFSAKLVGKDSRTDLALISFDSKGKQIPIATLGDSSALEVGDWVLAVGSPFGYTSTVTAGIVSAKKRKGPTNDKLVEFIQTDAAINSGNSGGALVNIKGELVGINSWIATRTGESNGLGFAIAINEAEKVIEDFLRYGEVEYGWLGVSIGDLSDEAKKSLGLESSEGALVHNLYIGSPANKGGLQVGDFIVAVDGKKMKDANDLVRAVAYLKPKQKVTFDLIRSGKKIKAVVTIAKRENESASEKSSASLWPGLSVQEINDEIRSYFKLDKKATGVIVVNVEEGSKASEGLRAGDLILSINDKKILNLGDFYSQFSTEKGKYMIEYQRGEKISFFGFRY